MNKGKITAIIQEALGEASAIFMSQEVKGTEIVMPTEELIKIANKAADYISGDVTFPEEMES